MRWLLGAEESHAAPLPKQRLRRQERSLVSQQRQRWPIRSERVVALAILHRRVCASGTLSIILAFVFYFSAFPDSP